VRLGAVWDGEGTRFAVRSRHAAAVELCLFDRPGDAAASRSLPLARSGDEQWQVYVPGVGPGQLYGFRASGPWRPADGHRFDRAKLLVDPYARAITGEPAADRSLAERGRDSAAAMPRSVVVGDAFDWQGDAPPGVPWRETVIYECHVRGMSMRHPQVPPADRGRFLGLASPPIVAHLKRLGVTTVELLPPCQIASEPALLRRGLRNYWGYNTLGYFAPHAGYASAAAGEQVVEFKRMVRALHRAGLEVLVDLVFNHTAEGGADGPTLCWRGLDNALYYRLDPADRSRYVDVSGCGNTLDASRPAVAELVLDCLRHWHRTMHVDGFRLDLATALGRGSTAAGAPFSPDAPLLVAIAEDPHLAQAKIVVEPWDLGPEGYQLGRFPRRFREWNDRFRIAARRYWRGDPGVGAELASCLAGSPEILGCDGREPRGVCYAACHDGFTLADLTAYERKHNRANGEDNRDGSDDEQSSNWGHEGPSDDPAIGAARRRARRNLLATVFLARGVPMLGHGDELGRSQGGNNNAYCQDNELSWIAWPAAPGDDLTAFVARLGELRRRRRDLLVEGELRYLAPGAAPVTGAAVPAGQDAFGVLVARGDEGLLLLLNGGAEPARFALPAGSWRWLLDTAADAAALTRRPPAIRTAGIASRCLACLALDP